MGSAVDTGNWSPSTDGRLRGAVEAMAHPEGAALGALDVDGGFVLVDAQLAAWLGSTPERMLDLPLAAIDFLGYDVDGVLVTPGTHPAVVAMATGEPVTGFLTGFEPRGDDVEPFRWFSIDAWPLDVDGERVGAAVHVRDISASRAAAIATSRVMRSYRTVVAALQEEQTRFRSLAENAADVVYQTDLESRCVWVSPAVLQHLGWHPSSLIGRRMVELVHPDDLAAAEERRRLALDELADDGRLELRFRTSDGRWRWMNALSRPMRDSAGRITGGLTALRDVHHDVGRRTELQYLASHDVLTGLLNRAGALDRLDLLMREPHEGRTVAVLYLDLDRFKAVNDAHGHQTGDRLLMQASHRLTAALRDDDLVARIGGDEFLVVLETASEAQLEGRAQDVHRALRRPSDPGIPDSTASVGMAVWDGVEGPDALVHRADEALYRAKQAGRDTVSW
jgi:diguanylate cyclase (GGDEF)-like protein/PAS domain S-box-containing protein